MKEQNQPVNPPAVGSANSSEGVTMRDYFAGMAMMGLIHIYFESSGSSNKGIAEFAYKLADAMLAERIKQ